MADEQQQHRQYRHGDGASVDGDGHQDFVVPHNMTQDEIDDLIGVFNEDEHHHILVPPSASAIATAAAAAATSLAETTELEHQLSSATHGAMASLVANPSPAFGSSPQGVAPVPVCSTSPALHPGKGQSTPTTVAAAPSLNATSGDIGNDATNAPAPSSSSPSVLMDDECAKALALSRKRTREKKRRLDENKQLADLTKLIKEIESHDQQKQHNTRSRTISANVPNIASRADLIGRTILLLERLHEQNKEQNLEIANLQQQLQAVKLAGEDTAAKLKGSESAAAAMMMYPQPNGGVCFGNPMATQPGSAASCAGGNGGGQVMMMMPMMMPHHGMLNHAAMMPMMNPFMSHPAGNNNTSNSGSAPSQQQQNSHQHASGSLPQQQQPPVSGNSTNSGQSNQSQNPSQHTPTPTQAQEIQNRQQQQQQAPQSQVSAPSNPPQHSSLFPTNPMQAFQMPMQGFGMQQHPMMMPPGFPQHPNTMVQQHQPNSQVPMPYMMPTQMHPGNFGNFSSMSSVQQATSATATQPPNQHQAQPQHQSHPSSSVSQPPNQQQAHTSSSSMSSSDSAKRRSSPSSSDASDGVGGNLAHCA